MIYQAHQGHKIDGLTVIGERGSGTNLLNHLVTKSFDLPEDNRDFVWKHGYVNAPVYRKNILYVVCIRNAMDWISSLYKRPHQMSADHYRLTFSEFIRTEWSGVYQQGVVSGGPYPHKQRALYRGYKGAPLNFDLHPIEGRRFKNPLELRTVKLQAHLSMLLRAKNVCVVRLEDLVRDRKSVLSKMSDTYSLKFAQTSVHVPKDLGHFSTTSEWRTQQTLNISSIDRKFMIGELNLDIEGKCNYHY